MSTLLDFEKPIAELEGKIEELRRTTDAGSDRRRRRGRPSCATRRRQLMAQTYAKLNAWQKTQVARHPDRPHAVDYIEALIEDFTPLAGDRAFADDLAVVGGMGRFRGRAVMVLGTERGHDTDSRVKHNFGMARPEGYRKARRLMELAGRFGLPILSFVDTAGAFPGIDAEARGQAEAIARSIEAGLEAARAVHRDHHRRRRVGRRHRAGRGRPRPDAGARDLFGDLARGLCLHPVARRRTRRRRRPRR